MTKPEYIYGMNSVAEMLRRGKRKIAKILVSKNESARANEISGMAGRKNIPVVFVETGALNKICKSSNHQGIAAEAEPVRPFSVEEALSLEKNLKNTTWLGIDGITDPMNLGAIIRSAACFGVSSVIIPERRTAGITPAVQKAASGAVETLNIISVINLNRTILELKEKGFWIYGADMSGKSVDGLKAAFPLFLLIGSEGEGLHQKTREHCDEIISVTQKGGVESLNASVAAAIVMYEISKQRG